MNTYIVSGAVISVSALAALAAFAAGPGSSPAKNPAVTLQPIPGSSAKRVTLTPKAAERLGIELGKVSEQPIVRKQMVGGLVVPPMDRQPAARPGGGKPGDFMQTTGSGGVNAPAGGRGATAPMAGGGFAGFTQGSSSGFAAPVRAAPAPQQKLATAAPAGQLTAKDAPSPAAPAASAPLGEAWVLVMVSPGEWERLAKDKPARVTPLATRDKLMNEIVAKPSGMEPQEDSKRSMLKLYYVVSGKDHGLELNKRMRIELQLTGSDETHKVVPYRAVYYDAKGAPWVYVNTQPLTYERQRVTVDRIAGDVAVLSDGPAIGTPIVITGAPLLYGAEVFGK